MRWHITAFWDQTAVSEAGEDIRGSHLYGMSGEKLGKIDDVIFDHVTADIRSLRKAV